MLQLKGSSSISIGHLILGYGILITQPLNWFYTLILIRHGVMMTRRVLLVSASTQETLLFLSIVRGRVLCPFQQLRKNIQPLVFFQCLWMKQILNYYGIKVKDSCFVTTPVAFLFQNTLSNIQGAKHINIQHLLIKDLVQSNTLLLQHISTDLQLSCFFTKHLDYLMKAIGVWISPSY